MVTSAYIYDALERKETLWLLELRIARLPAVPKQILAMYYVENAPPFQIAACFGLTESEITRICAKTVAALRKELLSFMRFSSNQNAPVPPAAPRDRHQQISCVRTLPSG
jgi:DNA-directed RNA polymerase specialized sigma24 family protein